MSSRKVPLRLLLLSVAFAVSLPLGAMAEKDLEVFSPKDGLGEGWVADGWTGMTVSEVAGKGKTQLEAVVSTDAEPYSGTSLTAHAGSGFNLSEKALEKGSISFTLEPGKDALGEPAAFEVGVQFAVSYLTTSGQTIHGPFNKRAVLDPAGPRSGRQEVTIPLKDLVKDLSAAPEELTAITGLRIQLLGDAVAGFTLIDCTIKED